MKIHELGSEGELHVRFETHKATLLREQHVASAAVSRLIVGSVVDKLPTGVENRQDALINREIPFQLGGAVLMASKLRHAILDSSVSVGLSLNQVSLLGEALNFYAATTNWDAKQAYKNSPLDSSDTAQRIVAGMVALDMRDACEAQAGIVPVQFQPTPSRDVGY